MKTFQERRLAREIRHPVAVFSSSRNPSSPKQSAEAARGDFVLDSVAAVVLPGSGAL